MTTESKTAEGACGVKKTSNIETVIINFSPGLVILVLTVIIVLAVKTNK